LKEYFRGPRIPCECSLTFFFRLLTFQALAKFDLVPLRLLILSTTSHWQENMASLTNKMLASSLMGWFGNGFAITAFIPQMGINFAQRKNANTFIFMAIWITGGSSSSLREAISVQFDILLVADFANLIGIILLRPQFSQSISPWSSPALTHLHIVRAQYLTGEESRSFDSTSMLIVGSQQSCISSAT
jgi:hypothetical protein